MPLAIANRGVQHVASEYINDTVQLKYAVWTILVTFHSLLQKNSVKLELM